MLIEKVFSQIWFQKSALGVRARSHSHFTDGSDIDLSELAIILYILDNDFFFIGLILIKSIVEAGKFKFVQVILNLDVMADLSCRYSRKWFSPILNSWTRSENGSIVLLLKMCLK